MEEVAEAGGGKKDEGRRRLLHCSKVVNIIKNGIQINNVIHLVNTWSKQGPLHSLWNKCLCGRAGEEKGHDRCRRN